MREARPPSALRRVRATDFLPHSAVAALAALCLAGYLVTVLSPPNEGLPVGDVELRFAYSTVFVGHGEYYRLVTGLFLHLDLLHLLANLTALWWFGTRIEQRDGARFTILAFLAAGIAGGAATYLFGEPTTFAVGASGALYGFAGILVAGSRTKDELRQALASLAILTIAVALVVPNVGHLAHAGGFVAGLVLGLYRRVTRYADRALLATTFLLLVAATTIAIVETNPPGG